MFRLAFTFADACFELSDSSARMDSVIRTLICLSSVVS